MGKKITYGSIKSLLHFDMHFWGSTTVYETNYGLHDCAGSTTWQRLGYANGAGYDITNKKFGRASNFFDAKKTQYLLGSQFNDIYNLDPNAKYEIEFFMRIETNQEQDIFKLTKSSVDRLMLTQTDTNKLRLQCTSWNNVDIIGGDIITSGVWNHVLIRINQGELSFFMNGILQGNTTITSTDALFIDEVYLGGYHGYIDEYCFRHDTREGDPIVPTVQYNGNIILSELYGYGSANLGDYTTIAANQRLNSYAPVLEFALNGTRVKINRTNQYNGTFGDFVVNDEVMIHLTEPKQTTPCEHSFKYCIRKVVAVEGDTLILDKEINTLDDFPPTSTTLNDYFVQVIKIPCFNKLTVRHIIQCESWSTTLKRGGIFAIKCFGVLEMETGGIINNIQANYVYRKDNLRLTYQDMINRLPIGYVSDAIFIMANVITSTNVNYIGNIRTNISGYGTTGKNITGIYSGYSINGIYSGMPYNDYCGPHILVLANNLTSMDPGTICSGSAQCTGLSLVASNLMPFSMYDGIKHAVCGLSVVEGISMKGAAIQKPEYAFNFTDKTYVDSFYLMGYQPNNTVRKLIFEVDGIWNKFDISGALVTVATQTPTTDSILAEGNTVEEIAVLKNITPFVGKQVRVAVAMSLHDDTVPTPTLRIGILAR